MLEVQRVSFLFIKVNSFHSITGGKERGSRCDALRNRILRVRRPDPTRKQRAAFGTRSERRRKTRVRAQKRAMTQPAPCRFRLAQRRRPHSANYEPL